MKSRFIFFVLFCLVSSFIFAQSPDIRGTYRGFQQSIGDPNDFGSAILNINFVEPPDPEFSGVLTLGRSTFRVSGKVDGSGNLKGKGTGPDGTVAFIGKWMDETEGAALAFITLKLVSTAGISSQLNSQFLRNFDDTLEPESMEGTWTGIASSVLAAGNGNLCLQISQDHDPVTGKLKTAIQGTEIVNGTTRSALNFNFVGTIDQRGHFLIIESGLAVRGLIGGVEPPDPEFPATYSLNFGDGSVDIGSFHINQTPPGPCSQ
ncbi:MAG: hypothetical protein C5B54_10615 [Acidobacteria bacterium]|nr:MAG: hypothetical protein C5B54_10615 [Acidobacteriota bacterium]